MTATRMCALLPLCLCLCLCLCLLVLWLLLWLVEQCRCCQQQRLSPWLVLRAR